MKTLQERLDYCDQQIAQAIEEAAGRTLKPSISGFCLGTERVVSAVGIEPTT